MFKKKPGRYTRATIVFSDLILIQNQLLRFPIAL